MCREAKFFISHQYETDHHLYNSFESLTTLRSRGPFRALVGLKDRLCECLLNAWGHQTHLLVIVVDLGKALDLNYVFLLGVDYAG